MKREGKTTFETKKKLEKPTKQRSRMARIKHRLQIAHQLGTAQNKKKDILRVNFQ